MKIQDVIQRIDPSTRIHIIEIVNSRKTSYGIHKIYEYGKLFTLFEQNMIVWNIYPDMIVENCIASR